MDGPPLLVAVWEGSTLFTWHEFFLYCGASFLVRVWRLCQFFYLCLRSGAVFKSPFPMLLVGFCGGNVRGELRLLVTLLTFVIAATVTRVAASNLDNSIATDNRSIVNTAVRTIRIPSKAHCGTMAGVSNVFAVGNVHINNPCRIGVDCVNCGAGIMGGIALRLNRACGLGRALSRSTGRLNRIMMMTGNSGFDMRGANTSAGVSGTRVTGVPAIDHDVASVAHLSPCNKGKVSFTNTSNHATGFAISNTGFGGGFNLDSGLPNNNTPVSLSTVRRVRIIVSPCSIHRAGFINNNIGTVAGSNAGGFGNDTCMCRGGRGVHNSTVRHRRVSNTHRGSRRAA